METIFQNSTPIPEPPKMKVVTLAEWKKEATDLFGEDIRAWPFVCPSCHKTQTLADFLAIGLTPDEANTVFFFSCLGRWVKERGCDWTLGGLFQIHSTEVIADDGSKVPVMEFDLTLAKKSNNS